MRATAGNPADQDVEAEALWHTDVPVSVMRGRVLAVAKLPTIVASLREILCVAVHNFFIILGHRLFLLVHPVVVANSVRNSIWLFLCSLGRRYGIATVLGLRFEWASLRDVIELPCHCRPGTVAVCPWGRLAETCRVAGVSVMAGHML